MVIENIEETVSELSGTVSRRSVGFDVKKS